MITKSGYILLLSVSLLSVGVFGTGCDDFRLTNRVSSRTVLPNPPQRDVISVHHLAGKLGLRVSSCDRLLATLRADNVVVMIFSGKQACLFVNGKKLRYSGRIDSVKGILFVPSLIIEVIRSALPAKKVIIRKQSPPKTRIIRNIRLGKIVIDAGHGGRDGGAVRMLGTRRILEKDINLSVATHLAAELKRFGAAVTLTRNTDVYLTLHQRSAIANRIGADRFISIHANAASSKTPKGHLVFAARCASAKSIKTARDISACLISSGIPRWGRTSVIRKNFTVLVTTSCPAVLVEMGFMTNKSDLGNLTNHTYQQLLAKQIAAGIIESFGK